MIFKLGKGMCKKMVYLETDRLILRDYLEKDFDEYCKLKMDSKTRVL